ncbi:MAG: hypothetical protein R8K50_06385 [Mariprofundus sp.]
MNRFPSTDQLLVCGADSRLHVDSATGLNHYLCSPRPDRELLRFGSSTASTISEAGFDLADQLRNRMAEACRNGDAESVYQAHAERMRNELRSCLELPGHTAIELAESGTDAHRLAAGRVRDLCPQPRLRVLMIAASETGHGVPEALCPPGSSIVCEKIAIRDADAEPLPVARIDEAVLASAESAVGRGEHLLLVMVDQSKSGCIAPSLSCGLYLRQRFPEQVHLLLDACQFRLAKSSLNAYLKHGLMVAVTGSKFFAGPSFSAALLLPDSESSITRVETPAPGLLLRWQLALTSMQAFYALDDAQISQCLKLFTDAIEQRLASDRVFAPMVMPSLERTMPGRSTAWDHIPTIFPFRLRLSASAARSDCASHADTLTIYQQLQQCGSPRVQLGRPIQAGYHAVTGVPIGALRLCISAPMIVDAVVHKQQDRIIDQLMHALDRVADKANA